MEDGGVVSIDVKASGVYSLGCADKQLINFVGRSEAGPNRRIDPVEFLFVTCRPCRPFRLPILWILQALLVASTAAALGQHSQCSPLALT